MKGATLASILALVSCAAAHGDHGDHAAVKTKPAGVSWQDWHMLEEHSINQYAPELFFMMHDNGKGWGREEILNLYGLHETMGDGSGMGEGRRVVDESEKNRVVTTILELLDTNGDQRVSLEEWVSFKGELPDFGYGQGHHFDFETEYEEHHWLQYHANDDPDVLIKHKEDIEHELLHHEKDIEDKEGGKGVDWLSNIRLDQVPLKYRKYK